MSLNIQKLNLDISIIRFESDMTPEDFSKELSGVIGKDVWRYTKNKYLNSHAKSEYVFYCGMGTNEQKYSILEDGAILIDNNTKKQLGGFSDLGAEEFKSKKKAFFMTCLSGAVEPLMVVVGIFLSTTIESLMPWFLSFSAGAMLYVVCEELLPDSQIASKNHIGTWGFIVGFVIMMIFDVALA